MVWDCRTINCLYTDEKNPTIGEHDCLNPMTPNKFVRSGRS